MSLQNPLGAVAGFFWELLKIAVLAAVIIVPIRYFLVQPFFVRGASMEPTFQDGEYLVIDELSYRMREPHRGEVIVFRYPQAPSQFFIKRIIGLPGETVRVEQGQVTVENKQHPEGVILNEAAYLPPETRTGGQALRIELGADEFFVLGDNRPVSSDSRSWGALPRNDIIGRVWVRAYPIHRWDIFTIRRIGFLNI